MPLTVDQVYTGSSPALTPHGVGSLVGLKRLPLRGVDARSNRVLRPNIVTMKKKKEVESKIIGKVIGITILCPTLNKNVEIKNYSFSASESECELCGSHGSIHVYVNQCECDKTHDIEISSW